MAAKILGAISRRQILGTGTAICAGGYTYTHTQDDGIAGSAEAEFNTSSKYSPPKGYTGELFNIKNDYPTGFQSKVASSSAKDSTRWPTLPAPGERGPLADYTPWLGKDYKDPKQAYEYCMLVKNYCWEGNANNGFRIEKNKLREWYHAPWMHYSANGREPINGLTYERATPPKEFAKTQTGWLQNWACGYYNAAGASVFGEVWKNPSDPKWTKNVMFPEGTCVFKILLTTATDADIPSLAGSPSLPAVIAKGINTQTPYVCGERRDEVSDVRLTQVDFAVRDDRAPIGWVFGTFMFDSESKETNPWDRIIPVGLMWGNDPQLNQTAFDKGEKVQESWINPRAEEIRLRLGGSRPSWGWNGRMNGPADNFISACASCHSTSQWPNTLDGTEKGKQVSMTPPMPLSNTEKTKWWPADDSVTMQWFRNLPSGQAFTPKNVSGDYSLQLMMGMKNYKTWVNDQRSRIMKILPGGRYSYNNDWNLRTGPNIDYTDVPPCDSPAVREANKK